MKNAFLTMGLGLAMMVLAGCTPQNGQAPDSTSTEVPAAPATEAAAPASSSGEQTSADGNAAMQVLLGLFKLDDTDLAIRADQADQMLPLLTAWKNSMTNGNALPESFEDLATQVKVILTDDQLAAIDDMECSPDEMQAMLESIGVSIGGPGMGNGNGQGGNGQPPSGSGQPGAPGSADGAGGPPQGSPPAGANGATSQQGDQRGPGSGGMLSSEMLDAVIQFLTDKTSA
jgi:hypothetical protein